MKTKRLKISIKTIILIISLIIFSCMSVITFAWFKDKESYSGNLTFGTIELDITSGVVEATKTIDFDITRSHGDYSSGGNIMPGDIINIPLKIKLKNSEPAYYLVYLTDTKNVFEEAMYFSDDGTNVYVNNGIKTYKQGTTTVVTNKIVGKISGTSEHAINIKAEIPLSFNKKVEKTEVTCKIMAIQQANLTESAAKTEIFNNLNPYQSLDYFQVNYLESTGSQIINTNYVYKTKPKIDAEICITSSEDLDIFGTTSTSSTCFIVDFAFGKNNTVFARYSSETSSSYTTSLKQNEWAEVSYGSEWIENGVTKKTFTSYDFSSNTQSIMIFGGRNNACVKMKIVKIYDGDALVRNFIPSMRKSDNKPGMYDTVSKTFFTNSGTGEFLFG